MNIPNPITLTHVSDPGHGWVPVDRRILAELGILGQLTTCSYQRDRFVYLEEDCDAGLLVRALKERGIEIVWKERILSRPSTIRSYRRLSLRYGEGAKA